MKWQDVRELFPDKWVLIEAIEAYTTEDRKRIVEQLSIISAATDFFEVMAMYKQINKHAPQRELFVVHTQNEEVEITVRYRFLRITSPVTAVHHHRQFSVLLRQINLHQQQAKSAFADCLQPTKVGFAACCRDFNRRILPRRSMLPARPSTPVPLPAP